MTTRNTINLRGIAKAKRRQQERCADDLRHRLEWAKTRLLEGFDSHADVAALRRIADNLLRDVRAVEAAVLAEQKAADIAFFAEDLLAEQADLDAARSDSND